MIKKIALGLLGVSLLSSCVSRRLYNELNGQYETAQQDNNRLSEELESLSGDRSLLEKERQKLQEQLAQLEEERDQLNAEISAAQGTLSTLTDSYSTLEKSSAAALKAEAERLNKLKLELEERSNRVTELEGKIAAQENQMKKLKDNLSRALNNFEGKGLTIEHKNGKVYVSMENKLLFKSGSWAVNPDGKTAVEELGKVLATNPDISVLIEGHTDNDKILGALGGGIEDNWDLSTKRATTIVNLLAENNRIDKKNLTAAGRSEYAPLASNASAEGKAKNRRIEVILSPKLDEISKMLNDL
ncbi:OmpA family protein [Flavobacterium sp. JP2137]|uniref:OmpA/MotB family protein n=1 Tax=Flavobacterium sp. JP2137 TaxID=3414510 RepID=UPI003D2FF169